MRMQNLQVPPEETFDAIWSTRTLIHVPQALVVDLLASWKRVLKPGGILGLGVNVGERNSWEISEEMSGSPMLYHYFADDELEEALEAAGYQVVEKAYITSKSNSAESRNFFVFAQRTDASLDKTIYSQYVQYDEHEKRRTVRPEDLESAIALLLRAGSLTPGEQANLCLLYDQLALRDRSDENRFKLAAQKLKLHLQTPETLFAEDFAVWLAMGELHLKLAQYSQAISCLEQALRLRPDHFATLVRLSYAYDGLKDFDKAIATAHMAERLREQSQVSDEERAELYHALGHYYINRSLSANNEASVQDREKGDYYMQLACSMFFFQAEDGIRDVAVTGVQTCALPIFFRLILQQKIHGSPNDRVAVGPTEAAETLNNARGDISGRGVDHGVVIGKGNVAEKLAVVVAVKSAPAAVAILHAESRRRLGRF